MAARRKTFLINDSTPADVLWPKGLSTGLVVPPAGSVGYAGVAEPFPADLLIPRSEWQARIAERKQRKQNVRLAIERAGKVPKNQNGTNYCATEDTEVLTDRGWVGWPQYNGTDLLGTYNTTNGMLEFQAPLATHTYEHDGPMIYSTNRCMDFGVTPDHRMLVRKWDESRRTLSDKYTFQRAGDIGWYAGLPHATTGHIGTDVRRIKIAGDREYDGDDFAAIVSLVVSDGYAGGTEKTKNWVSFACFADHLQEMVRAIANRNGFHECPSRQGVWVRYDAGALANWFRANAYTSPELGSRNKRVPSLIKLLSSSQIRLFLSMYGDQAHHARSGAQYFSTSRQVIDDLQELLLRVGKRGSIWSSDDRGKTAQLDNGKSIRSGSIMYHLREREVDRLCIDRKKHIETETYRGPVYCATVPNGTLITRRNGSILISGNCWINAPTQNLEVIRILQGQTHVPLSPASGGGPIKRFWNSGGWGREAIEWIVSNGLVPTSQWPDNAIESRYYTEEAKAVALNYRVDEWYVVEPRNLDEQVSCLLRGLPINFGLSWWGHEVLAIDVDWVDGEIVTVILNSYGTSWGDKGYGTLQGSRQLSDDSVAARTALAS
jgi:hypothetical protein